MSTIYSLFDLLEVMTLQQAYAVLEIDPSKPFDLKKARNTASMKHHPDRGGSLEKQKEVNQAYDLLSKQPSGGDYASRWASWEAEKAQRKKDNEVKGRLVIDILKTTINVNHFKEYIERETGLSFFPEFSLDHRGGSWADYVIMILEFKTDDKRTVFKFKLWIDLDRTDLSKSLGGGTGSVSFDASVEKFILHNNRENKLGKTRWSFGRANNIEDPAKVFPPDKIKKIFKGSVTSRKFAKRDMERSLVSELDAKLSGEWAYVPLSKDKLVELAIYRSVIMRMAAWNMNDLKVKETDKQITGKRFAYVGGFFPETEVSLEWLKGVVKKAYGKEPQKIVDILKDEYEKFKEKNFAE